MKSLPFDSWEEFLQHRNVEDYTSLLEQLQSQQQGTQRRIYSSEPGDGEGHPGKASPGPYTPLSRSMCLKTPLAAKERMAGGGPYDENCRRLCPCRLRTLVEKQTGRRHGWAGEHHGGLHGPSGGPERFSGTRGARRVGWERLRPRPEACGKSPSSEGRPRRGARGAVAGGDVMASPRWDAAERYAWGQRGGGRAAE